MSAPRGQNQGRRVCYPGRCRPRLSEGAGRGGAAGKEVLPGVLRRPGPRSRTADLTRLWVGVGACTPRLSQTLQGP